MTYATAIVRKIDNGFRGVITNESGRGLWKVGEEIFNRQFHPFPKGTLMRVLIKFSAKGRKMVQKVSDATDPKDIVETVAGMVTKEERDSISGKEFISSATGLHVKPESKVSKAAPKKDTPKVSKAAPKISRTGGYYVAPEGRMVFNTALAMSNANPDRAVKVMMVGPSGYGKTTLPKLFADLSGKAFLRMNCATVRDPEEWFGYREAVDGNTVFIRSAFAQALGKGNLVVVLDEFNRLEPWLHNTLFPLLDDDGFTVVHDERFVIGPGVIVVGTINSGYRYTGTFELDEALMNRFEFILEVGPMPFEEEVKVLGARTNLPKEQAQPVVKMANILRQNDVVCSTRTTLLIANMMRSGLLAREAYETAVVRRIPVDASGSALRKTVVDLINVELGPFAVRGLGHDIFTDEAEPAVAPEPESIETNYEMTIEMLDDTRFNMIICIKLIRNLPLVGVRPSLKEAKEMAEELWRGGQLGFKLNAVPVNLDDFKHIGLTGVCRPMKGA